jgi:hypothetical protein
MNRHFSNPINKLLWSLLLGGGLAAQVATAEDQPEKPASSSPTQPGRGTEQSAWTKFDLDFPGGSPRDLVSAIEKATGKPLNAMISREDETVEIPAMKFKNITIPDLFSALTMASQKQLQYSGSVYNTFYGFETQGHGEDAIYYFKYRKAHPPEAFCRFYQLAEILQSYSIEDVTTAVQTGWKMLGVKSPPQLKFHPETKLLIAVGPPDQLATIDNVLSQLRTAPPNSKPSKPQSLPPQKKDAAPAEQ